VAAVVCGSDGVRYEGRAGRLGVEDGAGAVGPDTVFRIASMTKALVSVGALGLLERDAIELDQPVAGVLPEFADLPVLEGFDGEEPRLRAPTGRPPSASSSPTPPATATGSPTSCSCATTRSPARRRRWRDGARA